MIREELQNFNIASTNHAQAYHSFLMMCEMGNWDEAQRCHLASSALLEAAMDAFYNACRLQEINEGMTDPNA